MIITHSPTLTSLGKEEISRNQFRERLTEFRWKVTDIHQDDGEDFYVDIYIDGRNTGVNFYVQLKSGIDLSTPRRDGYVSLDLDVPHLVRWSGFPVPVVLIAWDIQCREGRWVFVSDVIRDLDARSPGWRDGKTRRVRLPWANTTDDAGLLRLRRAVGLAMFPLLARGRAIEGHFKLKFPATQDGRRMKGEFERFQREGVPFLGDGSVLADAHFGCMHPWIWADGDLSKSLLVLIPDLPDKPLRVSLTITPVDATPPVVSYPLTLEFVQRGSALVKLSSEATSEAVSWAFVAESTQQQDSWIARSTISAGPGVIRGSVTHTRDFVHLLAALAAGGVVRMCFLDFDARAIYSTVSPRPAMAPDPVLVRLLDGLCTIQERLGMKLPPLPDHLTRADSTAIETALEIVTKGRYERRSADGTLTISTDSLDELTQRSRLDAQLLFVYSATDDVPREVLGCTLPVGNAIHTLKGTVVSVSVDDNSVSVPPYQVRVPLRDVTETWFYPDVLRREAQRLASDLKTLFGASQVFLFGSLAWDDEPIITGDLDLAVQGLPPANFVDALTWLSRVTTFDVDLVDLEGLPPHLHDRVLAEGILLDDSA